MIKFFFSDTAPSLQHRKQLKTFISRLFKQQFKLSLKGLTYIFCTDDYLLTINKDFLKHDFYTDIITFRLSDIGHPVEGEIYISVDRVKDNARICNTSFKQELHRVIFHGALHLCGLNDKSKKDALQMRNAEDNCLEAYFFGTVPRGKK